MIRGGIAAASRTRAAELRRRSVAPALALLGLVALACAERVAEPDLLAAAILARGGPLESLSRESELHVYYGFPGRWRWRHAFRGPEAYRLSILTRGEDQHYVSDGVTARGFIGNAAVTSEPAEDSCLRNHGRWLALIGLDLLTDPEQVGLRELPADRLPAAAARGLRAECRADGAYYELFFDEQLRLVAAQGPISIPVLGEGYLVARFEDFREVGGYRLPFVSRYEFNGQPFFDEHVIRFVPNDPSLKGDRFQDAPSAGPQRSGWIHALQGVVASRGSATP